MHHLKTKTIRAIAGSNVVEDDEEYEEEFSNRLWFKTLNNKINEIIKEKHMTREEIFENPYETAQILLKNITVESIKEFKKLLDNQEGDDE